MGPEARARTELISCICFADESQLPLKKLFVVLLSKNTYLAHDTQIPAL